MKALINLISRPTLLQAIKECKQALDANPDTIADVSSRLVELRSLCYGFLKNHTILPTEIPLFLSILTPDDLLSLKHIHSYNFNKLQIAAKSSSNEQA